MSIASPSHSQMSALGILLSRKQGLCLSYVLQDKA